MKRILSVFLLAGACTALAMPSFAQAPRQDAIWARNTNGQPITLDGVLGEPAWATAQSWTIRYGVDNGDPGSGFKEEAGKIAKDSTSATVKFLVSGDQLYLGITCRDSSVGGSVDFNRFDGILMALKDHRDPNASIHGPVEYFYSWWHPDIPALNAPGAVPSFRGYWSSNNDSTARTADEIQAWDAVTKVRGGQSNTDASPDSGYTIEMRIDVGRMGYTPSAANGDIIEWNLSIYDTDWLWPLNGARFSVNRAWWQGPWGNQMNYDEVRIMARPDVNVASGAVPTIGPEVRIPNLGNYPPPVIDGFLTDAAWQTSQHFDMRYGDFDVRNTYPGVMKWRAGFYQPPVNGGLAPVVDPGDATIHWAFKADTFYIGFDVRDQVVQTHPLFDRWDGFIVTIQDTAVARSKDRTRISRRLGFHVGPGGSLLLDDYLPFLRDTAHAARIALKLKPGTTVDTTGTTPDQGYTAELAINMTALGFPHGLSALPLYIGIDMLDGDSFSPITDSYGTRTWWGREYEDECCPATAYFDVNSFISGVGDPGALPARLALIGNYPNPFRQLTVMQYSLPRASKVRLEVFDLQGRIVTHRDFGLQLAGDRKSSFARNGLGAGIYLYRLRITDPVTGAAGGSLAGKMLVLK